MMYVTLPLSAIPNDVTVAHPSGGGIWYIVGPRPAEGVVVLTPTDPKGNHGPPIEMPANTPMSVVFPSLDEMIAELNRYRDWTPPATQSPIVDDGSDTPVVISN